MSRYHQYIDTTYLSGHSTVGAPLAGLGSHHKKKKKKHHQAGGLPIVPAAIAAYKVLDTVKPIGRLDKALSGVHPSSDAGKAILKGVRHVTSFLGNLGIGEVHHYHHNVGTRHHHEKKHHASGEGKKKKSHHKKK